MLLRFQYLIVIQSLDKTFEYYKILIKMKLKL